MKGNRNGKGFYLIRDHVGCPVGYYLSNYVGYCDVLFVVIFRAISRADCRVIMEQFMELHLAKLGRFKD